MRSNGCKRRWTVIISDLPKRNGPLYYFALQKRPVNGIDVQRFLYRAPMKLCRSSTIRTTHKFSAYLRENQKIDRSSNESFKYSLCREASAVTIHGVCLLNEIRNLSPKNLSLARRIVRIERGNNEENGENNSGLSAERFLRKKRKWEERKGKEQKGKDRVCTRPGCNWVIN